MSVAERCLPAAHLAIGWPVAYRPTMEMSIALLSATHALRTAGVEWTLLPQNKCPYLFHTRNIIATRFYRDTNATDLLFWDDDVSCTPTAAVRMAAARRPLVGGLYPKKLDQTEWPVNFAREKLFIDEEGLVEITADKQLGGALPTGFLRINRAVFDAITPVPYKTDDGLEWLGWFDDGIRDGKMMGEDVDFCQRWREAGGRIHMIPDIEFGHTGEKTWFGNWAEWQRARMDAQGVKYQKATAEVCVP